MRLVFAGTPRVAVPSLEAIHGSRHHLVAVLTRPPAAAGRGRAVRPSAVGDWADGNGVPVLTPASPRDAGFLAELAALGPDCVPVVAYGALLPPAALAVPRHGWVNLHVSLLPAWRGAAPVAHAVLAGDDVTGATTFLLEEGLDTGPVYGVVTEAIRPDDTAGTLLQRLSLSGAVLLESTVDGIADGSLVPVPQPADGVSIAPKITVDEARVRWDLPAQAVERRIRAVTPNPGAWTMIDGVRLKVGPVALEDAATDPLQPGQLQVDRREVRVGTGSQPVRLGEVQPPGKKLMVAADWARGARLDASARAS